MVGQPDPMKSMSDKLAKSTGRLICPLIDKGCYEDKCKWWINSDCAMVLAASSLDNMIIDVDIDPVEINNNNPFRRGD